MLETQDKTHPFYPANLMDRPHILYNACTKKYVLWAKTSLGDFQHSFFSVCIADTIRGPFKLCEKVDCSPYHAGDFDLIEENGTAYIIYENPHSEMICQTLSNDYTRFGEGASSHLPCVSPPYTREAPAFFARLSAENTSEADYVWLPVRFRPDGMPYIEWRTEWTIENFNE